MVYISLICTICLVIYIAGVFNSIETLRDDGMNRFFQVDVQLKNRQDLISELLEITKEYGQIEHEVVSKLQFTINYANNVQASTQHNPYSYKSMDTCISAQVDLMENLQDFYLVLDNYSEISLSKEVIELKRQIAESSTRSHESIKVYNIAVDNYNAKLQTFPTSLLAKVIGFSRMLSEETMINGVKINPDDRTQSTDTILDVATEANSFQTS